MKFSTASSLTGKKTYFHPMNAALEKILFQLTGKSRLEDVSLIELQKITQAHPYFSIGHLLLSQKLKIEDHLGFTTQVQRTAAHFSNPLWLHYQLRDEDAIVKLPTHDEDETKPLLNRVIEEERQSQFAAREKIQEKIAVNEEPEVLVAELEEEPYAADTTEEVLQQVADEEKQKEVIASLIEEQLAEFKKPVTEETELKIQTEPYYTVDYFASQGIKIDLNQPQDKLGSQLRKFTDWLKQMKSVQTESKDLGTDPEVENMIQGIAKTSNETKEIVTETMAEVLVKQGKTDKAVQLYIKLSFLNPDKSAYFAAKIEQLKGI
jgi:hypothetical protein